MLVRQALLSLAAVVLTASSSAFAGCPAKADDAAVSDHTSVKMSNGARLTIEGETLRVDISDGRYFHYSIEQDDAGPPTSIIVLSPARFVVLGPVKSFLGVIPAIYTDPESLNLQPLPVRYEVTCGFFSGLAGTCPIAPAHFSPAAQAVIVSGWTRNGSLSTLLVTDQDDLWPLEQEDGIALRYLWDDHKGHAVLRTRSGDGFLFKPGAKLVKCGSFPPLPE